MQEENRSLPFQKYDWKALLIGGISGAGKSTVAKRLGLRLGLPWLQVDDLRLALQWSRVTLPQRTEELYFFLETPDVWKQPPERLRDALIAVGEIMSPAIEVVVASHLATAVPIIIEGDGILPSLLARSELRELVISGDVQAVFIVESDEQMIFANMLERGRGIEGRAEEELRTEACAKWLYGRWLAEEARRFRIPVLEARPWISLDERILAVASIDQKENT
jgi:2-phosphoglycerate kinase